MSGQDQPEYSTVAERATVEPGIWFVLRRSLSSANLVTAIRAGRVKSLPADQFEARSYREAGSLPVRYTVEVRSRTGNGAKATEDLRESIRRGVTRSDVAWTLSEEAISSLVTSILGQLLVDEEQKT